MTTSLHDTDFFSWTHIQAHLIEVGDLKNLDKEHLVEELLDLAASKLNALESYYVVLFIHLLKEHYQPEKITRSWSLSIKNADNHIKRLLRKNPGMKKFLDEVKNDAYESARYKASIETDLELDVFPEKMPEWLIDKL
jgi:hypothetical protein